MRNLISIPTLLILFLASSCQKDLFEKPVSTPVGSVVMNPNHPLKDGIQTIIDKYIAKGVPGIQVAVKNADGWYFASGGSTKVENKTPFHAQTPTWLFSITKTYTAALIMMQKEKGLINLEAPISQYLPSWATANIVDHDKITVRMLLNHSSGITDFAELPAYQVAQFNSPLKQPSISGILDLMKDQKLLSTPGQEYSYSNTNYLLLTLMLEKVSGKPYKQLLKEEILTPFHLENTYFAPTDEQTTALGFPNYYMDRYANEQLENVTAWNNALARACAGWGGISATSSDAIRFYEKLMLGLVVSHSSLGEMTTWFQGKSSSAPDYGFGLEHFQYAEGTSQFGHEGDGIGSTTMLLFVPDNSTYLFINITAGRKLYGPYLFKVTDFKNELCKFVSQWQ